MRLRNPRTEPVPESDQSLEERRALDELFSVTYEELRRLAYSVRRGDPSATLSPTALVHEAWLKLANSPELGSTSRLHFKRIAARAMRQLLIEAHHVSPVYDYRERRADETPQAYGERLASELEAKVNELGGENVMAFVAETVVGATLGAVPAVPGYFRRVREICNRHGILLILDEVMCGMGRTGTLHACEQEGISPDVMAVAKGLGGGYAPIGALLIQEKIFNTIAEGSGAFLHSHTYMGHPLACAAALAVQRVIRRDGLLANVRRQGECLKRRLKDRFGNHHHVGDVRGRGLMERRSSMLNAEPRLPARLSLEQLRKKAKDLLRAYHAGEESARKLAAEAMPNSAVRPFSLADAHCRDLQYRD